jgi:hypothetical protein
MVMEVIPVFANVDEFIVVRLMSAAKITLARLVLPLKAKLPILVTVFGMVIEVRPVMSAKAYCPILVTVFGIVMEVMPVMFRNALLPIPVIPVFKVRLVTFVMFIKAATSTLLASVIVMVVKLLGIV